VQRQVVDDDLIGGGSAQLACQAIVVAPHTRVRLPCVLVDRRGLAKALREARCADLPAEHVCPRGFQRRQAILAAVVAPAPPWVVAYHRPRLCVARSAGVDDVAGIAVLGLSARVKDSLPDRRSTLVGRLFCRAVFMDRRLPALSVVVIPCTAWLAHAGHRAFGLLNGRLLDERLRLAVQVPGLGRRWSGHGP
jgi:hypothetical protein